MKKNRRSFSAEFKGKVALAAIKGDLTMSEICSQFEVQPAMVNRWRKELVENANELFADKRKKENKEYEDSKEDLYKQIGKLQVQVDFLRKKLMPYH